MEHIVDLCSGRDTALDHRIEHLCDYHIRHFVRLAYALYFMLNDRQYFQRDRIAKIPSGNDDFVAVWKERFKMRQTAFCLDLGIQTNIRPRPAAALRAHTADLPCCARTAASRCLPPVLS